ncbi:hypothetical protein Plo01_54450 [Planobispora longispora]|uniref:HNH domain-containing protein n=1 Tax=Planobispora longispora TaxID=28887 RepID=A0A8J3RLY5_9ACTN|nr:hypothetical protein Plo01_54450 [Planobispora longispora]
MSVPPRMLLAVHKFSDTGVPTHEEIARYWCGRALPGSDYIPFDDLGEPECFACGWCRVEQVRSKKALAMLWKGLERAHVVPRALGGPDAVENVILLCQRCHRDAPDTADAARFWRWVVEHPRNGTIAYLAEIAGPHDSRARDYTGPQAKDLHALASLSADEFQVLRAIYENAPDALLNRLHEAERRIGGVSMHWGVGISTGTMAELLREVVRHELAMQGKGSEEV